MKLHRSLYKVNESAIPQVVPSRHHGAAAAAAAVASAGTTTVAGTFPPSPALRLPPRFTELEPDECTRDFLAAARLRRSAAKDAVGTLLQSFGYSLTDANAILDRGRMFVMGTRHVEVLLGERARGRLLLDVGAGDGNVTAQLAGGFDKVVAVETSVPMGKRLRARGYHASTDPAVVERPDIIGRKCYDLVMLMNVLDRADKPLSLLRALRKLIRPESGRLLLGVVLPWCPFVEDGKHQRPPKERMPMDGGFCREGATFERSVSILAQRVLEPMGYEIEQWTRLPYLSEGDGNKEIYTLDDAVFVLKPVPLPGEVARREARAQQSQSDGNDDDVDAREGALEPNFEALDKAMDEGAAASESWASWFRVEG